MYEVFPSLNPNLLQFISLHFTSLHFTSLHFTSLHFTSLHRLFDDPLSKRASSGILRRVPLVRTEISEELSASFFRMRRIGEIPSISSQRAEVVSYS
jgi:hypothetical protein